MNCPKCKIGKVGPVKVDAREVPGGDDQITVDRCFTCGGIWFDTGELDSAIREWVVDDLQTSFSLIPSGAEERKEFDQLVVDCPRCAGVRLEKVQARRQKVSIDRCPKCQGVWVDGDELARFDTGEENRKDTADMTWQYLRDTGLSGFFGNIGRILGGGR